MIQSHKNLIYCLKEYFSVIVSPLFLSKSFRLWVCLSKNDFLVTNLNKNSVQNTQ